MVYKDIIKEKILKDKLPEISELSWRLSNDSDQLVLSVSDIPDKGTFEALERLTEDPEESSTYKYNNFEEGRGSFRIDFPTEKDDFQQAMWDALFEKAYARDTERLEHLANLNWQADHDFGDGYHLWGDELSEEQQLLLYYKEGDRYYPQKHVEGVIRVEETRKDFFDSEMGALVTLSKKGQIDRLHGAITARREREVEEAMPVIMALPWQMNERGLLVLDASIVNEAQVASEDSTSPAVQNDVEALFKKLGIKNESERFGIKPEDNRYLLEPPNTVTKIYDGLDGEIDSQRKALYTAVQGKLVAQSGAVSDLDWQFDPETRSFFVEKAAAATTQNPEALAELEDNKVSLTGKLANYNWRASDIRSVVSTFTEKLHEKVHGVDIGSLSELNWERRTGYDTDQLVLSSYELNKTEDRETIKALGIQNIDGEYVLNADVVEDMGAFVTIKNALDKRASLFMEEKKEAILDLPWELQYGDFDRAKYYIALSRGAPLEGEQQALIESMEALNLVKKDYGSVKAHPHSRPFFDALEETFNQFIEEKTSEIAKLDWEITSSSIVLSRDSVTPEQAAELADINLQFNGYGNIELKPYKNVDEIHHGKVFDDLKDAIVNHIAEKTIYPDVSDEVLALGWEKQPNGQIVLKIEDGEMANKVLTEMPHIEHYHNTLDRNHQFTITHPKDYPEKATLQLQAKLYDRIAPTLETEEERPLMPKVVNLPWRKDGDDIVLDKHQLTKEQQELMRELSNDYAELKNTDQRIPSQKSYILNKDASDKTLYETIERKMSSGSFIEGP